MEYLDFIFAKQTDKQKTKVLEIYSKKHGNCLGEIRWWGAWRQYVFAPYCGTVYSRGCMDEINVQIKALNEQHKKELECRLRK
jgi:hypothetical protein